MRVLLLSLCITIALSSDSKVSAQQSPLVGSWRLVSFQTTPVGGGKTLVVPPEHLKGYVILTQEGRLMTVATGTTGSDRKKIPTSDADEATLWETLVAYTGRYRIEGNDFVTKVDVSWNEAWIGTEQRRHYKVEGDTLTVVSAPYPVGSGSQPNAMVTSTLVLEREE
ncbi:MAG TPA: lipocalin-like domain-containing protein [Candidatus Acidoferrales bacterium]|nr:lipocalin-like domain-containing protein [Candidatus Acidoferrales bacterium]